MEGRQFDFSSVQSFDELDKIKQQIRDRRNALFKETRLRQVERMIALGTKWNTVLESHNIDGVITSDDCGTFNLEEYRVELCDVDDRVYVEMYRAKTLVFEGYVDEDGAITTGVVPFDRWAYIANGLDFALFFLKNLMAQRAADEEKEKEPEKKKNKTQ